MQMLGDDLLRVVALERRRTGEHLEQHDPDPVDVGPRVHILAAERLLGTHVERRADDVPALGRAGRPVEPLHDAEVHEQRAAGRGLDEDVVGLDVPMHEPVLVGVLQSLEDRLRDRERAVDRQRTFRTEQRRQRAPLAEGHDVKDEPRGLTDEMDRQRVGMAEAGDRPRLLLEAAEGGRAPGDVVPQHLHRQPSLQVLVADLVHLGETAASEQAHHAVLAPERPRQGVPALRRPQRRAGRQVRSAEQGQTPGPAARAVHGALGQRGVAGRADQQLQRSSRVSSSPTALPSLTRRGRGSQGVPKVALSGPIWRQICNKLPSK